MVWARAAGTLVAGIVLGATFPPLDVGPLVLVALVPLLWLWRDARPGEAALYGFAYGLGFYGLLLEWTRYFGAVAIVPLVVACAAYLAATGAVVAVFARRGLWSPWLVAAVWVVLEGLKSRFPLGGFPWGELGVALHDLAPARALASVGGVALVTYVIVAWNALVVDVIRGVSARRTRGLVLAVTGLVALLAVTTVADALRFEPSTNGRLRFALLQGNDQNRDLTRAEIAGEYLTRSHLDLAARLRGQYDLIVFPESALEYDPETDASLRNRLVAVGAAHDAVVLANARHEGRNRKLYNANLAYDPDGRLQGVYAKNHLVPFGEYVPWRDQLSFIGELQQVPYDFTAGTEQRLFRAGGRPFGSVICFESAFGPLVRDQVRDGAEAIVVSTNNRSYRRSGLSTQHVAFSQMRAAETGRAVLHAAVSGISAVVDADGDVRDTSELFVNRITSGSVAFRTGETLYVRLGDWVLALSCLGVVGAAGAVAWRSRRRRLVQSAPVGAGDR